MTTTTSDQPRQAISWNAPTIFMTVNAALCGLASLLFLTGDVFSTIPDNMKAGNIHTTRALGHELAIVTSLMVCSIVNNYAHKMCLFWAVGLLPSVWTKYTADLKAEAFHVICFIVGHLFFGLVWREKNSEKINWNGPTIEMTLSAFLCGVVGLSLLAGDDSAVPFNMKSTNVHAIRALGHEICGMFALMVCSIVNNKAQKMCPYAAVGILASVWTKYMADEMGAASMNLGIALMHLYFGFVWQEKVAKKE